MTAILSEDQIKERIAALTTVLDEAGAPEAEIEEPKKKPWRFIRPFAEAAEGLIDICRNSEYRWMFGIPDLDDMIRGVGRGQLMYVTGRSHSGKTQLVLQSIANNADARVLYFTPDEAAEEVLTKLVAMVRGIDGERIEEQIKAGNEEVIDAVRRTAAHDFRNMIVIDEPLNMDQMTVALREAELFWGGPADVVVIDYLEIMETEETDSINSLSKALKRWGKGVHRPIVCLRQNSRSSAKRGQAAGISGMSYGGENEAIFVIEVYRKREDDTLEQWQRDEILDTITINVAKNKRPPCKKGEVDLMMDERTGVIRPKAGQAPLIPRPRGAGAALAEMEARNG